MSETQDIAEAKPASTKPVVKKPAANAKPKSRTGARIKLSAGNARAALPPGQCACYVAIPGKVSRGQGVEKAQAGEQVIGPIAAIEELELRGIAFRNEDEAKAAFTSFKRKREAEIKRAVEAERIRRERRERIKAELYGSGNELDWKG